MSDVSKLYAALSWQIDLGATEAISDAPIDRYALDAQMPRPQPAAQSADDAPAEDPVLVARQLADQAGSLEALRDAIAAYPHCDLKRGARNLVFCDGQPGAGVMVIGEAPGAEEDRQGKPFVGRAGHLLDQMFAAIGLSRSDRTAPIYISNILPWRPPQNRDPKPEEIAMMLPFVERHVTLAEPKILVLMGNIACQALLGKRGITRLRGHWVEALGRPVLPMFHPAYLLRNPGAKREAWHDLLMLKKRLADADA